MTVSAFRFDDQASWLLFSLLKTVVKTFWLIELLLFWFGHRKDSVHCPWHGH